MQRPIYHETLSPGWLYFGPASVALAQRCSCVGSASRVIARLPRAAQKQTVRPLRDTRLSADVIQMLAHRRRRWTNIKITLAEGLVIS